MSSKAELNQIFQEDYSRTDQEVKELQKELLDTLTLNDELTKNIEIKEEELITKEKRYESLKERNAFDEEQLELETTTLTEKFAHEIAIGEDRLKKLEMQEKRYLDIQRDNNSLKQSILILQDILEKSRIDHADKMHMKNLEMKELRESMERKMRDQLNQMDNSYQKDAFIALSEKHKKAMFQNSKLKDEVALQGVGLNNLGSRLAKQTLHYQQCIEELRNLNKKSAKLRKSLADISIQKTAILKENEKMLRNQELLFKEKEYLKSKLNENPTIDDCKKQQKQLDIEIIEKSCEVLMWKERLHLLNNINLEIKPVSDLEAMGRFDQNIFSLEASKYLYSTINHSDLDHSNKRKKLKSKNEMKTNHKISIDKIISEKNNSELLQLQKNNVKMSIKPSELELFLKKDALLADALSILKGKEGIILVPKQENEGIDKSMNTIDNYTSSMNENEMKEQNMVQWIVLQILDLWTNTEINAKLLKEKKMNEYEQLQNEVQLKSDLIQFTNINDILEENDIFKEPIILPLLNLSSLNDESTKSYPLEQQLQQPVDSYRNISYELNIPTADPLIDPSSLEYKQIARDWIENGDLDENTLQDIWDDSFHIVNKETSMDMASWLKVIPNSKKLPISTYHLDTNDLLEVSGVDITDHQTKIENNLNRSIIAAKEERKLALNEPNVRKLVSTAAPPIVVDKLPAALSSTSIVLPKINSSSHEVIYNKSIEILDPIEHALLNDPLVPFQIQSKKKTMKLSQSREIIRSNSSDLKNNLSSVQSKLLKAKTVQRMSTNSIKLSHL